MCPMRYHARGIEVKKRIERKDRVHDTVAGMSGRLLMCDVTRCIFVDVRPDACNKLLSKFAYEMNARKPRTVRLEASTLLYTARVAARTVIAHGS